MDFISLWLGLIAIAFGVLFMDVKGLDWAQSKLSSHFYKVAITKPLVREFPASSHNISLDSENKTA